MVIQAVGFYRFYGSIVFSFKFYDSTGSMILQVLCSMFIQVLGSTGSRLLQFLRFYRFQGSTGSVVTGFYRF